MKIPVFCLMGPTATGKTALAIELVQQFPLAIISVDSAMIYRGMNIGSGKPNFEELRLAPHQLIDICDPVEAYSAAQFCEDAKKHIQQIVEQKKVPFLVGGTMLYYRALQQGLSPLPSANPEIRKKLIIQAETLGLNYLHQRLQEVDPVAAARIHPNDPQRLQRALEVYEITGQSLTDLHKNNSKAEGYSFINIALFPEDRNLLHHLIEKRFSQMVQNGLVEEVEVLSKRPDIHDALPSIRSVGYRQVWQYIKNQLSKEDMYRLAIAATRQLAKRQMTWLRTWPNLHKFDSLRSEVIHSIKKLLQERLDKR